MKSHTRLHRVAQTLTFVVLAVLLAGCAATKSESGKVQAIFYPDPPAPPRLQFLTSFSDAADFKTPRKASFSDWVVGAPTNAPTAEAFASPYGLAIHNHKIYLCDIGRRRVHVLDLQARTVGKLESDRIRNPVNITIDSDGTKYICDTAVGKVLVFDAGDQLVAEIGDPTQWAPVDVAIRGNELFVTDTTGGQVEVWSKQGSFVRAIGAKGRGVDQLLNPTNLAFGPDGRLFVVDTFQQIVKVFDPKSGQYLGNVGQPGTQIGSFARPKGIAIAEDGTTFVSDAQWDVVQVFNAQGQLLMLFGKPGREPWSMGLPATIYIDRDNIDLFRTYLAPGFEPEFLLFVINQFGMNKVAVYAFGRDTKLPAAAYEVNMDAVAKRRAELRAKAEDARANATTTPR